MGEMDHGGEIDEALYSRQLYVMGHEAQKRMATARVLVVGMTGIGVEIAKNIVLAGVREVVILDDTPVSMPDLASQFYLSESYCGVVSRAEASWKQLSSLNPYVKISKVSGKDSLVAHLEEVAVVVSVDQPLSFDLMADARCRERDIKFIATSSIGLFGRIFNDFGQDFVVLDADGEECKYVMIAAVTSGSPPVVTCLDEHRHGFQTGDFVKFSEVLGMEELNGIPPVQIVVTGPYTFTLKDIDISSFSDYIRGGVASQVKMPKKISFKSLEDSLKEPDMIVSDFAKFDRLSTVHASFRGFEGFVKSRPDGIPPRPGNSEDAESFSAYLVSQNLIEDTNIIKSVSDCFARTSQGSLSPMAAVIGGVAGQEVLKAISGKFMPIMQYFYFDCTEALPEPPPSEEDCRPQNCRYDGQIMIFGASFQEKISQLNYFLVGAGAIGCEMLKNWAMMGVGAKKGKIVVTDMDRIEKSNLSRQFLFRDSDIGKPKSLAAAHAAKQMNPELIIEAFLDRVGPETESVFDDKFWESLSGVCNALDNIQARLYVDQRCVYFRKSLLESGTLGTKGNVQIIVPHLTESYGSSRDPPEKSIPICTLKNFPYQIEHTIQWARDYFEGTFRTSFDDVNVFLDNPDQFVEDTRKSGPGATISKLEAIYDALLVDRPTSADDCFSWARNTFENLFSSSIKQLIHTFPHDMLDSHGIPFWSGTKRAPSPIQFDPNDATHMDFIVSAASLRAVNFGVQISQSDMSRLPQILESTMVSEFVPKVGLKIATTDAEAQALSEVPGAESDETRIGEILSQLKSHLEEMPKNLVPIEFEKDDDTNHHVDFVTSCSNLRAMNYSIEPADRHRTKRIAGKIIPAIATTTAFVTGLVCIELYKLIKLGYTDRPSERIMADSRSFPSVSLPSPDADKEKEKLLSVLKNGFANLALPFFGFSEPVAAPKREMSKECRWTIWDRFEIEPGHDMTLQEFLDLFEVVYHLQIVLISCGVSILYSSFVPSKKLQERLPMTMSSIAETVGKFQLSPQQNYLILEVCCSDETGADVEVPYIRYRFRY
uniref:E1 ubiquitin-activating enzyme n=1 Tax=Compsopogon caeruleus TaxID=31354 RepID=A0A7S1TGH3_9RHOD|mmetsp:Transcript_5563/g.11200  ORF Transcript_5563/g.11200 Transcript_5563/m.11200 type:complete len:1052 (+) Transcript_5563:114-3269(+)